MDLVTRDSFRGKMVVDMQIQESEKAWTARNESVSCSRTRKKMNGDACTEPLMSMYTCATVEQSLLRGLGQCFNLFRSNLNNNR